MPQTATGLQNLTAVNRQEIPGSVDRPSTRDAILRVKDLPTLPTVLSKILATAADPDASALDLGQHIQADQSLSATLLKLVNSAYYGFYRQIKSVTQAIVVLGFIEVRNLTLTATAFRTLKKSGSDYDRQQLWRHSLGAALAADKIAKSLGLDVEGCFEAALLHDIGKVVLDLLYPDQFMEAARRAHAEQRYIADIEREVFNLDHAEAGGILGEHWNLPGAVVEAIRFHHQPERAQSDPILAQITALANYLTYPAELGESSNSLAPVYPEFVVAKLGLRKEKCDEIAEKLRESRENIDSFVGNL